MCRSIKHTQESKERGKWCKYMKLIFFLNVHYFFLATKCERKKFKKGSRNMNNINMKQYFTKKTEFHKKDAEQTN